MKLPETTSFGTKLIVAGVLFFCAFFVVIALVGALDLTLDPKEDFAWFYGPIVIVCLGFNLLYATLSKFDRDAIVRQIGAAIIVVALSVLAVTLRG